MAETTGTAGSPGSDDAVTSDPRGTPRPTEAPAQLGRRGRLALRLVVGLIGLLRRLPDRPLYRIAYLAGVALYPLMGERRRQVRANLRRVCRWAARHDLGGPRVVQAASDRAALERLVRAAFGHWVLGYLEGALAPQYSLEELRARVALSEPDVTAEGLALRAPGELGPLHMAIHFGAVDLSAVYGLRASRLRFTGPMESLSQPLARAYFEHVRGEIGADIVPLEDAAATLQAAIAQGDAAGLVADRNVVGRGAAVELFGAPARLPIGPAVLSVQTGATVYVQALQRTGPGAWLGHTVAIKPDPALPRKEAMRRVLEAEARAIEGIVARAPEQWTTLFFPIWSDE